MPDSPVYLAVMIVWGLSTTKGVAIDAEGSSKSPLSEPQRALVRTLDDKAGVMQQKAPWGQRGTAAAGKEIQG